MKPILVALVLFISNSLISQETKTYSGAYQDGFATYSYYESSDFERIYNGNFSYKKEAGNKYSESYSVSGNFSENKKNGVWTYKVFNSDEEYYIIGSYVDGRVNGDWSLKHYNKKTNSNIREATIQLKDGKYSGKYNDVYRRYDYDNKNVTLEVKISSSFNDKGQLEGLRKIEYNLKGEKREDISKYMNGVLYYKLYRNLATGEIISKFDSTDFVNTFFNQYNNEDPVLINNELHVLLQENPKKEDFGYFFISPSFSEFIDVEIQAISGARNLYKLFDQKGEEYQFNRYGITNLISRYSTTQQGKEELDKLFDKANKLSIQGSYDLRQGERYNITSYTTSSNLKWFLDHLNKAIIGYEQAFIIGEEIKVKSISYYEKKYVIGFENDLNKAKLSKLKCEESMSILKDKESKEK